MRQDYSALWTVSNSLTIMVKKRYDTHSSLHMEEWREVRSRPHRQVLRIVRMVPTATSKPQFEVQWKDQSKSILRQKDLEKRAPSVLIAFLVQRLATCEGVEINS